MEYVTEYVNADELNKYWSSCTNKENTICSVDDIPKDSVENFELKMKAFGELEAYLLSHEDDIAVGINDFADLRLVFNILNGRDAVYIDRHERRVINGEINHAT